MKKFLSSIFSRPDKVDVEKLQLKARLSLEYSIFDKDLFSLASSNLMVLQDYLSSVNVIDLTKVHSLRDEYNLLQSYIRLWKDFSLEGLNVKFESNFERDVPALIHPFILFPLVQNAIKNGYNGMEKFPIRIRVQDKLSFVKLEVSNRVNHYIGNQENNEIMEFFKSRLDILYSQKYNLIVNSNTNLFKATLILYI